jgi:hypothetical protein
MQKLALLWAIIPALASAQAQDVPLKLGFQGRLVAADGTPLAGVKDVTFSIYRGPTDTTALWTETQKLALTNGFYATFLGAATPLSAGSLATGTDLYVGVTVDGTELAPRQEIGSVVYAFRASHAVEADHAAKASSADLATRATNADTSTNLSGGAVNATAVVVSGGVAVVDSSGNASFNGRVTAGSVSTGTVGAGTVTAGNVGASSVSATTISATNLSASSASMPGLVLGGAQVSPGGCGVDMCWPTQCVFTWGHGYCDDNGNLGCYAGTAQPVAANAILCVQ